ncbi:hypothetical protein ABPG74_003127 [Tetrahymena malaccensis]
MFMSHMPYRIVDRLITIFNYHKIENISLLEYNTRFNQNISIQMTILFEINLSKTFEDSLKQIQMQEILGLSIQNLNLDEFFINQLKLFQKLIKLVFIKPNDKISLSFIDFQSNEINQLSQLINSNQLKQIKNKLLIQLLLSTFKSSKNFQDQAFNLNFTQILDKTEDFSIEKSISSESSLKSNQSKFICDENVNQNDSKENLIKESSIFHLITHLKKQVSLKKQENLNKSEDIKNQNQDTLENQKQDFENSLINDNFIKPFQQTIFQQNRIVENKQNDLLKSQDYFQNLIDFQYKKTMIQRNEECCNRDKSVMLINETVQAINIIRNQHFHNFVRNSLNQLFFNIFTFRLAEKNNYYIQKNERDQKQNKRFAQPKKFCLSQINNNRNALKFIFYQTEKIEILNNCLFKSLCKILSNLGVQILIYSGQKGSNFLEKSEDLTYYDKEQEIIKIFYSHEKVFQFLSFKRDQFYHHAYLTYIQNF